MLSSMDEQEQSRQQNRELREHKVLFHHRLQLLPKVARCGWVSEGMHSKEGWLGLHYAERIVELGGCEEIPNTKFYCFAVHTHDNGNPTKHPGAEEELELLKEQYNRGVGCSVAQEMTYFRMWM